MSSDYQLIVFDWDGTLMDSEARIVSCIDGAIQDLGLESRDRYALKDIIGLGLHEAINTLYPGSDETLHRNIIDRYRHHFLTGDSTPSELFSGAHKTLQWLSDAGYLLAVATGKGRVGLDKVLEETGLGPMFQATRCSDETHSKPNPQMLNEIMDEMGMEREQTLMVGDTEYDLLMAKNAGTDALAVSYGVHEVERLLALQPMGVLNDIGEMVDWIKDRANEVATG